MKASTVAFLGLFVVFGVINNAQGMKGKCGGYKHTDEDKEAWEKCGLKLKAAEETITGETEIAEDKKKQFLNATLCLMRTKGMVTAENKLNVEEFNKSIDTKFDTPEAGQKVKDAFKKCSDDEKLTEKTYSTLDDAKPLLKCSIISMKAGCKTE